jgi:valyl-tRNA synthetase
MQNTLKTVTKEFKNYRFDLVTQAIYDFIWHKFCDWYLELTKPVLNSEKFNAAIKQGARKTLITVLENLLRIAHPFIPFITEEIWQEVKIKLNITDLTIMLQKYPGFDQNKINQTAHSEIEWLRKTILAIRNIRGEINIPPAKQISLLVDKGTELDRKLITKYEHYLRFLVKIDSISWLEEQNSQTTISFLVDDLELHVVLSDLNISAEIKRLEKEIEKTNAGIKSIKSKLDNPNYITKAPEEVVAKTQSDLAEKETYLAKILRHFAKLTR